MTAGGFAAQGAAVRSLAERWLRELDEASGEDSPGRDFVCSPAGLWLALGAVAAGARGATADELRELLGVAGDGAAEAVTEGARALAATDALAVAGRVWTRVPVYDAYRKALPDIGFGPMPTDGAEIDAWVREATGGLIERLSIRIDASIMLALVNALALKACWETPFDAGRTRDLSFTDASGAQHEVATMQRRLPTHDAWRVREVSVVELRTEGAGARVRFVLGPEGARAADVLPAAWAGRGAGIAADAVSVALPRFSLRTKLDVLEQLPALGVLLATSDDADFSAMSPVGLKIGRVAQEAVVKIAEKGIEAAAVTVVAMVRSAAMPPPERVEHIAFDRPFGIVVLDGSGEVPLFAGWQASAPAAG
ncbi:serpin family protein [Streptomyces beijiangensis]|uniref:Serine protease n=1 Tax=Streptomyces beijiangensis TaxID=163361 RepID=A0A939JJH6_9ACTN|nr:serpin family protein [Streptomyces beijiangensis]MBO0516588.1 serine protease [Streptomyces beijiangensis]